MSAQLVNRECLQCDRPFQTEARYVERGAGKYCSRECAHLATRKKVEKTCAVCGNRFEAFHYLRNAQKACSQACARKLTQKQVECTCLNCGKTFFKRPSQFNYFKGAGKYCSRACVYAGKIKENADQPSGDRWGRTDRNADKEWRKAVREKDKNTCQRCGKVEPYIHAHHVAPRSRRPDLKYDISNGKCLCNSCHTWVHRHPVEATDAGLLSDVPYETAQRATCRVCGAKAKGHELCEKHYTRWRKYGDPLLSRKPGRPATGDVPVVRQ